MKAALIQDSLSVWVRNNHCEEPIGSCQNHARETHLVGLCQIGLLDQLSSSLTFLPSHSNDTGFRFRIRSPSMRQICLESTSYRGLYRSERRAAKHIVIFFLLTGAEREPSGVLFKHNKLIEAFDVHRWNPMGTMIPCTLNQPHPPQAQRQNFFRHQTHNNERRKHRFGLRR